MQNNVDLASYIKTLNDKINSLESTINEMSVDVRASRKNRFQRKTQAGPINYMSKALCVQTTDPMLEQRVRFYHPLLHEPNAPISSLPYAKPVSALGGFDDSGLAWVPPAGSTLCIIFENGHRSHPHYIGTSWHRDRGPNGSLLGIQEYAQVSQGHRHGYLVGPNDESQVLPPWNTESYNSKDFNSTREFVQNTEEQKRHTFPNIFGFKTPEKHMMKMVDGDAKCNRKWKRLEIMSGCGNWLIMKDDHLHFGGQWAHPSVTGKSDIGACHDNANSTGNFFTDPLGNPIEGASNCDATCDGDGKVACSKILGGHPNTPPNTMHEDSQGGANKYFKNQNECRPYKGPGTPQNNKCDLPQSGIQFLSISGHSLVMDDSVEEPRGKPTWERSLESFDFGCNNKYLGRTYLKSATGHSFVMSDIEEEPALRGADNFIEIKSATGNKIQLNDHTIGEGDCTSCPPNTAGPQRGIHIQSTSNHVINMVDHMNEQCSPCRKEGGTPIAKATQAYMEIKSGYGSELRFSDDNSQETTQRQFIQITQPQCGSGETDAACNRERGPHYLRFQGKPQGEPGIVFLRAGGHSIRSTHDMDIVLVGDKEKNPSDKFTYVSKMNICATEDIDFRYTAEMHIMFAEKYILLMAGRDCPPSEGKKCCGPCLYPVIIGRCPVICPLTGIVHWTEKAMSERVFASAKNSQVCTGGGGTCPPGGEPYPCTENEESTT